MLKYICLVILLTLLAGCGGLEISSLTVDEAKNAHKPKSESGKKVPGYIVYHPMIVVDVNKDCKIGEPKTLPDYEKPFLLKLTQGIGKFSVDLKIEDGWRLDGIKAESDYTALLEAVQRMEVLATQPRVNRQGTNREGDGSGECEPGLYKLFIESGVKMKFERITIDLSLGTSDEHLNLLA